MVWGVLPRTFAQRSVVNSTTFSKIIESTLINDHDECVALLDSIVLRGDQGAAHPPAESVVKEDFSRAKN